MIVLYWLRAPGSFSVPYSLISSLAFGNAVRQLERRDHPVPPRCAVAAERRLPRQRRLDRLVDHVDRPGIRKTLARERDPLLDLGALLRLAEAAQPPREL
jgi:hypothetical protein